MKRLVERVARYCAYVFCAVIGSVSLLACSGVGESDYNPTADAQAQLLEAKDSAEFLGKNMLVQIGGYWCPWCVRLNAFIKGDAEILEYLQQHYVWVHIYYGKDNRNEVAMKMLGNPTSKGFPVFVVCAPDGTVLHHQSTGELEAGKGYSRKAIMKFLQAYSTPPSSHSIETETVIAVPDSSAGENGADERIEDVDELLGD